MPPWRCPHCGTPQAESSRCWVCKRSSTSCGTCRHFRRSIAVQVAYCGLDPRRAPLRGDEMRGCWEEAAVAPEAVAAVAPVPVRPGRRDFVPFDAPVVADAATEVAATLPAGPPPASRPSSDGSLWADLEG